LGTPSNEGARVNETVLQVTDLTICYDDVTAVDGLTLSVHRGEVLGLLGGNGAGKSSTLRAMAGVNAPTSGLLTVAGHDMSDRKTVEKGRAAAGYCPDVGGLIRQATVREHVALALAVRGNTHRWPQAMETIEKFDLMGVLDRPTAGFSHGMSRRLSVLLAVLQARDILILDEPFDGVDPLGVEATMDAIRTARDAGLGVLVSTHLIDLLVAISDRIAVVVGGKVVAEASPYALSGETGKARYADLLKGSG
jgi:ABC-2 type transport system ATP-binding protein